MSEIIETLPDLLPEEKIMQDAWKAYFHANSDLHPFRDPGDLHVESLYAAFLKAKRKYLKALKNA